MNKLETLQRLQEIKLQLLQIKKERDFLNMIENQLKTEYTNMGLEIFEEMPSIGEENDINNQKTLKRKKVNNGKKI